MFDTTITHDGVNSVSCGNLAGYIFDRPCTVTTVSGGTTVSQKQYTYNANGHATQTSTFVSRTAYLNSYASYNANGTLASSTDANGAITNYYYNGSGGCNGLLLTSTVVANLTTSQQWNCNGGVLTQIKDANSNPTTYGYVDQSGIADPFWRQRSVTDPQGNTTWKNYTPTTNETYLNFPSSNPTSTVDVFNTLDGLGRVVQMQRRTAPNSTNFDNTVQYGYGWDSTGQVLTQTTLPGGTAFTTTQLDALGRVASVTDGGGVLRPHRIP